jgi:transposase
LTSTARSQASSSPAARSKNQLAHRAKISQARLRQLVRYFAVDLDASQIAQLMNLNRNTVNRYTRAIRERIAENCASEWAVVDDTRIEASIWLARRIRTQGGGAGGEVLLFRIFTCNGRIGTQTASRTLHERLQINFRTKIRCNKIFYLSANGAGSGESLDATKPCGEIVQRLTKISDLETFWSYAKSRFAKFHGMSNNTFELHLCESQFRFNNRSENLYKLILTLIKKRPLF